MTSTTPAGFLPGCVAFPLFFKAENRPISTQRSVSTGYVVDYLFIPWNSTGGSPCGKTPTPGQDVLVLIGDEIAHQSGRSRHRGLLQWSPESQWAHHGQECRIGEQPCRGPCQQEGLPIVGFEDMWPQQGEITLRICADQLKGQLRGFQTIINALTIEWVHTCGGITDEHPIGAGHIGHRATHGQQGRGHILFLAQLPFLPAL